MMMMIQSRNHCLVVPIVVVLLFSICTGFQYPISHGCRSFVPKQQQQQQQTTTTNKKCTTTTTPTTQLRAFLWFGGGNNDKDDDDDGGKIESKKKKDDVNNSKDSNYVNSVQQQQQQQQQSSSTTTTMVGVDEIASASLRRVSTIMDSMSSFKSSQRIGERATAILEDLSTTVVEGQAADGKIKISYNGQQKPVGIQIDESYLQSLLLSTNNKNSNSGTKELEIAITKAMEDAHTKSGIKLEEKLKDLWSKI